LIGYGPSAYQQAIMPILGLGRRSFEYSPYNVFIWIAVEAGPPGILGITFILAGIFREAIKFRRQSDGVEQWILRCAPVLLLLIVIWYTFGNWWDLSLTWFLMGLILVAARLAKESVGSVATA
jgi:O-antigen ligase